MFKKILITLVIAIGIFAIYVATRPSEMLIAREIVIKASPEVIFPYLNNSQKANGWMPWKDSDPGVVMNYAGPEEGVGSRSSWESEGQMGTGEALVVESVANHSVKTQLTYTKPFQMLQLAEISLAPVSGGTKVRWSVSGHNNFFFKLMGVFMNCDKMVGGEFEKGLLKLKAQVESASLS